MPVAVTVDLSWQQYQLICNSQLIYQYYMFIETDIRQIAIIGSPVLDMIGQMVELVSPWRLLSAIHKTLPWE
jgi:hypothetical protein